MLKKYIFSYLPKNVWTPPQIEDNAKLMSIKKNKKDHNGAGSISSTADGYETNASVIPPPIWKYTQFSAL